MAPLVARYFCRTGFLSFVQHPVSFMSQASAENHRALSAVAVAVCGNASLIAKLGTSQLHHHPSCGRWLSRSSPISFSKTGCLPACRVPLQPRGGVRCRGGEAGWCLISMWAQCMVAAVGICVFEAVGFVLWWASCGRAAVGMGAWWHWNPPSFSSASLLPLSLPHHYPPPPPSIS